MTLPALVLLLAIALLVCLLLSCAAMSLREWLAERRRQHGEWHEDG